MVIYFFLEVKLIFENKIEGVKLVMVWLCLSYLLNLCNKVPLDQVTEQVFVNCIIVYIHCMFYI